VQQSAGGLSLHSGVLNAELWVHCPVMIHDLTMGHLDPAAMRDCVVVALKPLVRGGCPRPARVPRTQGRGARGLSHRPLPWHGREDGERGEAFAARLQAETGCLVCDRRNGRIAELARELVSRTA